MQTIAIEIPEDMEFISLAKRPQGYIAVLRGSFTHEGVVHPILVHSATNSTLETCVQTAMEQFPLQTQAIIERQEKIKNAPPKPAPLKLDLSKLTLKL